MINFEIFEKRLDIIKKEYYKIDKKIKYLLNGLNVILEDVSGVAADWIYNILENELYNFILAVNNNIIELSIKDIIDYYLWDGNFGGFAEIEEDGEKNIVMIYPMISSFTNTSKF